MHDDLVKTLRIFLETHGASFDEERRRLLRAQLTDLSSLDRGRAAIVVAAAEEGVPRFLQRIQRKDATKSITSLADKLANRLHVSDLDAAWAVQIWAAALNLIDANEIQSVASPPRPTVRSGSSSAHAKPVGRSSVPRASTQQGHFVGRLAKRRNQIVASMGRIANVLQSALKIVLLLSLGVGAIVGLVVLLNSEYDVAPPPPERSGPIAQKIPSESVPEPPARVLTNKTPPQPSTKRSDRADESTPIPGLITTIAKTVLTRSMPSAPTPPNHELVWGDRGSFPHSLAISHAQIVRGQEQRTDNELRRQVELAEARARLATLLSSQQGRRVKVRMAVIDATPDELILCADVSWGWPTEDLHSFSPQTALEEWAPRCGLVRLVSGSDYASETVRLRFGNDVPTSLIGCLQWNDKVLVEFDVLTAIDPGPSLERPVRLQIERLKFISAESTFRWTDVWPAKGTFPHQVSAFASWSYKERRTLGGAPDFESFLTYANQTLKSGRAKLPVLRVTESSIELSNDITAPDQGQPGMVYLVKADDRSSELSLPIGALGRERASRLTKDSAILVAFDVASVQEGAVLVPGKTGFGSRLTAGVEVAVRNLRLGEGG